MRTNLTFLSVSQAGAIRSVTQSIVSSSGVLGLWRGTSASLIRYAHSPLFSFLGRLFVIHRNSDTCSQQRPRHRVIFYQSKSSPWLHGRFTRLHGGPKTRIRKAVFRSPRADQFGEPSGRRHHPRCRRLRIEPFLSAQGPI